MAYAHCHPERQRVNGTGALCAECFQVKEKEKLATAERRNCDQRALREARSAERREERRLKAIQHNAELRAATRLKNPKRAQAQDMRVDAPSDLPSYVYFVEALNTGFLKIGFSTNVADRLASIQTGCPSLCVLLFCIPGGRSEERELHLAFSHARGFGEWFEIAKIEDAVQLLFESGVVEIYQPTCRGCGRPRKLREDSRGHMRKAMKLCSACARTKGLNKIDCRLAEKARVETAWHEAPVYCACGKPVLTAGKTQCRSCGMRKIWDREEYREKMRLRDLSKRKTCLYCLKNEPRVSSGAKYHAECWEKKARKAAI